MNWSQLCQNVLDDEIVPEVYSQLQLPVVPQSIVLFTQLARRPNVTQAELAQPIQVDSALTTRLLRHVNSVAVGLRKKVFSVQQAIATIGIRRTKLLLLTAALQNAFRGMSSSLINATAFAQECEEKGTFAREAAPILRCDPELAYTGAVLQDLLLPIVTEKFADIYERFDGGEDLVQFEQRELGWNHARLTARLMLKWGFPMELAGCVLLHHEPQELLESLGLLYSSAGAVMAAGLLPDNLNQSPRGLEQLVALQDRVEEFQFLDLAQVVDEELGEGLTRSGNRTALSERLGAMVVDHLERQGMDDLMRVRQIGSYSLGDQIGRGSMGVVHRAQHCRLQRPAAVKLLTGDRFGPDAQEWFEREVQLTSQLTSPHTVEVYDYGVTPQGVLYYVMEFIDGITLGQLVSGFGPQPEARVIHILSQVCNSLSEAHNAGLLHRDIKPENIMLARRGGVSDFVKVLDFGLAEVIDLRGRQRKDDLRIRGTPYYMSPEAVRDPAAVDPRSDIYSLGVVGYYLLTGRVPFSGNNVYKVMAAQVGSTPKPTNRFAPRPISPELEGVVMSCLQKNPMLRPNDAETMKWRLSQCARANEWSSQNADDWWAARNETQTIDRDHHPTLIVAPDSASIPVAASAQPTT